MWQSGSAVGNSFFNEQEEKEGDMTHAAKQFAIDTTLSGHQTAIISAWKKFRAGGPNTHLVHKISL